jgi:hypothetical protein
MQTKMRTRLDSLPRTEASFIEPMDCLSVSKLPESDQWIWEILCGGPHKTSYTHSGPSRRFATGWHSIGSTNMAARLGRELSREDAEVIQKVSAA